MRYIYIYFLSEGQVSPRFKSSIKPGLILYEKKRSFCAVYFRYIGNGIQVQLFVNVLDQEKITSVCYNQFESNFLIGWLSSFFFFHTLIKFTCTPPDITTHALIHVNCTEILNTHQENTHLKDTHTQIPYYTIESFKVT